MDIGGWLRGLGLERYEAAFRHEGIDVDVLADLTEKDLSELGLTLGDRKRLLKAIALLSSPSAPSPSPAAPARKDDAERRPITVMFCDLVGSTEPPRVCRRLFRLSHAAWRRSSIWAQ